MPRPWPREADEAAYAGERDVSGLKIWAAEAQVGAERIGQGDELDEAAMSRHGKGVGHLGQDLFS